MNKRFRVKIASTIRTQTSNIIDSFLLLSKKASLPEGTTKLAWILLDSNRGYQLRSLNHLNRCTSKPSTSIDRAAYEYVQKAHFFTRLAVNVIQQLSHWLLSYFYKIHKLLPSNVKLMSIIILVKRAYSMQPDKFKVANSL